MTGTSELALVTTMFVVNLPLGFLIRSPSGNAVLTMPIFAPLADLAGVGYDRYLRFLLPLWLILLAIILAVLAAAVAVG